MQDINYTNRAAPGNSNPPAQPNSRPTGLTVGGAVVWQIIRRPASTCNVLASLAGLGSEAVRND